MSVDKGGGRRYGLVCADKRFRGGEGGGGFVCKPWIVRVLSFPYYRARFALGRTNVVGTREERSAS